MTVYKLAVKNWLLYIYVPEADFRQVDNTFINISPQLDGY